MAQVNLKLHTTWSSPFGHRVIWSLKLKGIQFEYVEEDLKSKSPQLLQYNPVYKTVPILVHDGKPVSESMIIVEYIDEVWPHYPLLPSDPYERAVARFWVKFSDDKSSAARTLLFSVGEAKEKAVKEILETLKTAEELCLGEKKFFGGDKINIVDLAFGWIAFWLEIIEDIAEVKLLEAEKFPYLYAWTKNFKEADTIKENLPDAEKIKAAYGGRRQLALGLGAALQN